MKQSTKTKQHFYQRKVFWWITGAILGLIVAVLLAFRLSPYPGAWLIRAEFDKNDVTTKQALEKHTPTTPVTVLRDQPYRPNDNDALLDVYYAQGTSTKQPVIIWTHGGAWVSGNKTNAEAYFKLLAVQGFTVIAPRYSLAPEHTYPTPVHQLNTMYQYIQENTDRFYADTTKTILAGDSAGSQLSSQMAALITNPEYARQTGITPLMPPEHLRATILFCGIYKMHELTVPNPVLPKLIGWGTEVSVWAYAGTRDFNNPIIKQMSPYYHATKAFPATFISGGNGDPLTDVQSKPMADRLSALGVPVETVFYPEDHKPSLPHEYQFNLDTDDGKQVLQKIITFAKSVTQ